MISPSAVNQTFPVRVGVAALTSVAGFVRLALLLTAVYSGTSAVVAADLRVAGSDLVGGEFSKVLEAFARRQKVNLVMEMKGSWAGMEALRSGAADIALAAFAPEKEPDGAFVLRPIAYRIAVVVAPERLGVTQISYAQLEGFFGAEGAAGFSRWSDLGVTGAHASLSVGAYVLKDRNERLALDIFSHAALRVRRLKSSVRFVDNMEILTERLASPEGGLAIFAYVPPAGSGLRALAVAKADGEPAFSPTPENIAAGDYPLRLAIHVVYRREREQALRPILDFLASEEVRKSLAANRLLVPATGGR